MLNVCRLKTKQTIKEAINRNIVYSRTVDPYLSYLSQGICWWDSLVAVDGVALYAVRALWRCVAWWHVGWGGC